MTTDPFDGVGILTQEIGQPTFVELIYTQRKTGTTIKSNKPNVLDSLSRAAFNTKPALGSSDPAYPHTIAPTQQQSRTYSITTTPQSIQNHQNLNAFSNIVKNAFIPQDVDCAFTAERGIGCASANCEIDIIFAIDKTTTQTAINDLKDNITKTFDLLDSISGNYRAALITFSSDVTINTSLDIGCMTHSSTNTQFLTFMTALNSLTTDTTEIRYTNSNGAIEAAINGEAGLWRNDAYKILVVITDSLPGGSNNTYDATIQAHIDDLTLQAQSCGVNIIAVNVGNDLTARQVMNKYAEQSNGKYIESVYYITSFLVPTLRNLCDPLNIENINRIINGSFDTTISGWTQNGSATWASAGTNGFMVLNNGSVEQTIINLTPGSKIRLRLKVAGVVGSGDVYVELNGSGGAQPVSGGLNILNGVTIERNATVSQFGTATIIIENRTNPNIIPIYVDEVSLYEIEDGACGFGVYNLILNSEFEDGVDGWTDINNTPLTNSSWDSTLNAIIVNSNPVRIAIDDTINGKNLVLMFEVYENIPATNDNLQFSWTAKNDETTIASGTIVNSNNFPTQHNAIIQIPSEFDGPLYIEFSSDGIAKVKNVYCCDPGGYCPTGMTRLAFDQFETNRGSWAGGIINGGSVQLSNDMLQQTFFELIPNTILRLSVNCITVGGIILEIYYTSNNVIEQFFSTTSVGVKSFSSLIPEGVERATIRIRPQSNSIIVDDILVCHSAPPNCDGSITNLRTYIEWNGVPRSITNIFNIIARITYRDPHDPFKLTIVNLIPINDGHLGFIPTDCNGPGTCDFWKQQGDAGVVQDSITSLGLLTSTVGLINHGDIVDVTSKHNWLWAIPANKNGTVQDGLATIWDDPPTGLIESIQFLILINHVNPIINTAAACAGPFQYVGDPANSFDFIIRYRNSKNEEREFRTTFNKASLYQNSANYPTPTWDTITPLGNGVKGNKARWETTTFILDSVDGAGIDQCTSPIFFSAVGQGNLQFGKFELRGEANALPGCTSELLIEEIEKGNAVNEVQSITLPSSSGGRWAIQFTYGGVDNSTLIPWNANAKQVRNYLGSLPNTGGAENILVSGAGSETDPFLVEFTNQLGGMNLQLMAADGSGLTGTGSASVSRLRSGTSNEQQTITKESGITSNLRVIFAGSVSRNIPYNASLNAMQAALAAIPTIGTNNVTVSGSISDRDVAYQGPWHVRFIGTFSAMNVPDMTSAVNGYTITTDWQGGVGANELQLITVVANSGTYVLSIPNPNPTGGLVITDEIDWNASAAEVSAAIVAAAPWLVGNIKVTKLPHEFQHTVQWTVEFKGVYARDPMDLMQAISIGLRLTKIVIQEITRGGGVREQQKVQIIDTNFGSYRLIITINGVSYTSSAIRWNSEPKTIKEILMTLPPFTTDGDVEVTECTPTAENAVGCYIVSFHPRFDDVGTMQYINNLSCNPISIGAARMPPYEFDIPECETPSPDGDYNFRCTPGQLLCKPGDGDDDELIESCAITDSSNVYSELVLQRELYDPNRKTTKGNYLTIKDLAVLNGLKPSQYNAYLRNFSTGALTETSFSTTIENRSSIVLILKDEDTVVARRRIAKQLQTSPNILPSRML